MATDAQGRQLSDDGYYFWDGTEWRPVHEDAGAAQGQPGEGAGQGEGAGGTHAGGGASKGDVPDELVALGAAASLADWTAEQRTAYFTGAGSEPRVEVTGDDASEIEVLAIADTPAQDGEELA